MEIKTHDNTSTTETNNYSPDQRIDINQPVETQKQGFDVDARIDTSQIEKTKDTDRLNDTEKDYLRENTNWSDNIINHIHNMVEAKIYMNDHLKYEVINGRDCLIRNDIDMNLKDDDGLTNKERMEEGKAPIVDGRPLELHHIGQDEDSPLAELTSNEHKENYSILHDSDIDSRIPRNKFISIRQHHWDTRSETGGTG